ncbi:Lactonase drp35 (plasmid) [Variovorax sp. SRS16]|uniref:SMP-30/gluconolactonase/LRE family protein n=1 Tax=Variovorax sp. SRS16 TaxID=282217 RepID=UPI0013180BD3|nr:SMP-30/gluconolactonase/LRE family protein [Variovorax sp. SRS16]VTU45370.1 Lactonase drp35 [Variovorax sp. SRS16]
MDWTPLDVSPDSVLSYTRATGGFVPIPACERELPTVTAQPYFKVSDRVLALEGPAYDRQGNLLFVDTLGGRVLRLSADRVLTTVYTDTTLHPAGIAVHKDGRIFVAGIGNFKVGSVIALDPDGAHPQTIVPASAGYLPDDLVFDRDGGFYFTDFKGTSTTPAGGVYYVAPDFATITAVLPNMSAANGVALSPDGKVLWATEFSAGRLHRADLHDAVTLAHFGSTIPYHFVGSAPDSMRSDADGNVYVAMYHQGRVLAFSAYGIPIGQILLPGREDNHFLESTSLAFVPGSRDLVIVARDESGGRGSMIFRAQGLSPGAILFSHQ